jgi:hypothetical protein
LNGHVEFGEFFDALQTRRKLPGFFPRKNKKLRHPRFLKTRMPESIFIEKDR